MRKGIVLYLLLLAFLCVLIGCAKNNGTRGITTRLSEEIGMDEVYQKAYSNCITYIENSSNANRQIDTSIVSVERLEEKQKEFVQFRDEQKGYFSEIEYWLFTIGNTEEHNYILLVCESQSGEVIGAIPTK